MNPAICLALIVVLSLTCVALGLLLTQSRSALSKLELSRTELEASNTQLERSLHEAESRLAPISNISEEVQRLEADRDKLLQTKNTQRSDWGKEVERTLAEIESITKELEPVREEAIFQSFGIYEPHFDFDTSERYKEEVRVNREQQKQLIKSKGAAVCDTDWTVDGSKAKGRQMTEKHLRLMLRAFNGECNAAIGKARFNNVTSLEDRIERNFAAINKLGAQRRSRITEGFKTLKLEELRLAYEYALKKQEEKQEQSRIRVAMREEEQTRKEIEKAQKDAEKEEVLYEKALAKAKAELDQAQDSMRDSLRKKIHLLEDQLNGAHDKKEKAISRAQLTKSGHVYVISNLGSFGDGTFKIGLTRRLDPLDRVKELGDASVPFPFDVHAMIYCEDAPALEQQLHGRFRDRQVNLINPRKEFFNVDLASVETAVGEFSPDSEFIRTAVAEQYRESEAIRRKRQLEAQKLKEQQQVAEVTAAKDKFERLREHWKAEPIE